VLDARLTTLLCKKTIVKHKEVKRGSNLAESSKQGYNKKRDVLLMMMMVEVVKIF
jgi:hypothetical protein